MRAHRLRWLNDPSNQDLSLRRNVLRQRVLPRLQQEQFPHVQQRCARLAQGLWRQNHRLQQQWSQLVYGQATALDVGIFNNSMRNSPWPWA